MQLAHLSTSGNVYCSNAQFQMWDSLVFWSRRLVWLWFYQLFVLGSLLYPFRNKLIIMRCPWFLQKQIFCELVLSRETVVSLLNRLICLCMSRSYLAKSGSFFFFFFLFMSDAHHGINSSTQKYQSTQSSVVLTSCRQDSGSPPF